MKSTGSFLLRSPTLPQLPSFLHPPHCPYHFFEIAVPSTSKASHTGRYDPATDSDTGSHKHTTTRSDSLASRSTSTNSHLPHRCHFHPRSRPCWSKTSKQAQAREIPLTKGVHRSADGAWP